LIPKGEKCGIEANMGEELVVKQGLGTRNPTNKPNTKLKFWEKYRGKNHALRGRSSPRLDGGGKHPSKCKWFNFSILANLCLL
jgi:hypothetical protein